MKKKVQDLSTEEKIKEAARKIFTKKGYAATRTRDIAEESGINLALLNYYFRSKEKLFELVMLENFGVFINSVKEIINNTETTLDQKIENIVEFYINQLLSNPDLPLFIMNEIRSNSKMLKTKINKDIFLKSYFIQQLSAQLKKQGKGDINPVHYLMNVLGMTIMPFIMGPLLIEIGMLKPQEFEKAMIERKKLIPTWIKTLLQLK